MDIWFSYAFIYLYFCIFPVLCTLFLLSPFGNITVVSEHNLGSACEGIASMLSEEEENSHRKEKAYKRDKGKSPLFGEMEGKDFSELLQTMHELKIDIKGMRRERHEYPSIIFAHE